MTKKSGEVERGSGSCDFMFIACGAWSRRDIHSVDILSTIFVFVIFIIFLSSNSNGKAFKKKIDIKTFKNTSVTLYLPQLI